MLKGKRVAVLSILMFLLFVGGCSFDFVSVDNLMRAPKLTGIYGELEQAFEASVGDAITLQSPRSGSYRTAFVLHDIDGDFVDEALVFYTLNSDASTVHIHFLDYVNDEWISAGDETGSEREIHELLFKDLDGDRTQEIIVNFSTKGGNKLMSVYGIDSRNAAVFSVSPLATVQYQSYMMIDLDRDSTDEIFYTVFEVSAESGVSVPYARVLKYSNGTDGPRMEPAVSLPLQSGISAFSAITADFTERVSRVYLDCLYVNADTMITEVIAWTPDSGYMLLMHKQDENAILKTSRPVNLYTEDIDNDNMMEIPGEYELPCSEILNVAEGMQYKSIGRNYYKLQSDGSMLLYKADYADPAGRYLFDLLSIGYYGKICTVYDCLSESTAFYIYDSVNKKRAEHLFTLQLKVVNGDYTAYYDIGEVGAKNGFTPALIGKSITILDTDVKE